MARLASSLPGTGKAMPCGFELESRIAITGMPRTLASLIASSSLFVAMTNMTYGRPPRAVGDAAQRVLQLVPLAGELKHFLLGETGGVARQLLLKALEALDRV